MLREFLQDRDQWLPTQAGHTALTFSNGLKMAHNDASRACEAFVKGGRAEGLRATYESDPVPVRVGVDTDNNIIYETPAPVVATGDFLSWKPAALLEVLTGTGKAPARGSGQPLKFSNGTAVTHSDESRAHQAYQNAVAAGRKKVPGLKAEFSGDGWKLEGIQKPAKIKKLMKK